MTRIEAIALCLSLLGVLVACSDAVYPAMDYELNHQKRMIAVGNLHQTIDGLSQYQNFVEKNHE